MRDRVYFATSLLIRWVTDNDILQKRLHQQRRTNLTQEIREIRQEFTQGQVKFGSVNQFLKELDEG